MITVTLMIITLVVLCIMIGLFACIGGLLFKLLYTFLIGLPIAAVLVAFGILFCVTIIGIPIGVALFRAAGVVLFPFAHIV